MGPSGFGAFGPVTGTALIKVKVHAVPVVVTFIAAVGTVEWRSSKIRAKK